MKKIIVALAAVLVAFSANAQIGIVAGLTSSSQKIKEFDAKNCTQYHVGVAYKLPLPAGFAIQPELLYNVKGSKFETLKSVSDVDFKTGYLELGAQVQWGLDLKVARPYLFAEPFLGYALNSSMSAAGNNISGDGWDGINRLEYGVALGLGVEVVKHVQISAKYFWNMGNLYNNDGTIQSEIIKKVTSAIGAGNVSGISISAAFLF